MRRLSLRRKLQVSLCRPPLSVHSLDGESRGKWQVSNGKVFCNSISPVFRVPRYAFPRTELTRMMTGWFIGRLGTHPLNTDHLVTL